MKYALILVCALFCVAKEYVFGSPELMDIGSRTQIENFPYLVQLFVDMGGKYHFCAASLISANYLLTAAHCVYKSKEVIMRDADHLLVKLGSEYLYFDSKATVQSMWIYDEEVDIIIHPDFSPKTRRNNIALIRLPKKVQFKDHIKPIKLSSVVANPNYSKLTANVSGWGSLVWKKCSSNLHYIEVNIRPEEYCSEMALRANVSSSKFICSSEFYRNCSADTGSPLELNGVQIGIASFSSDSAILPVTSFFTPVSAYRHWISEHSDVELS